MSFYYKTKEGKIVEFATLINLCKKRGVMSVCAAASIKDQHGCRFRIDSTVGDHCSHFRETFCNACDSVLAQIGKDPYDCHDCQFYSKCVKKNTADECTLAEKAKEIGKK